MTRAPAAAVIPDSARAGAREALLACAALTLLLALHHAVLPGEIGATLVAAFEIYVPIWLIERRGESIQSHGIHAHGALLMPLYAWRKRRVLARRALRAPRALLDRLLAQQAHHVVFNRASLVADARAVATAMVLTFPPFIVGFHLYQTHVLGRVWHGGIADGLPLLLLTHICVVGLAEELFFRGFLETRLERAWPSPPWRLVPINKTVIVVSALFALTHLPYGWNVARLATFFPAFMFSAIRRRSGSIAGAAVYHGLCNVLAIQLAAMYGDK